MKGSMNHTINKAEWTPKTGIVLKTVPRPFTSYRRVTSYIKSKTLYSVCSSENFKNVFS